MSVLKTATGIGDIDVTIPVRLCTFRVSVLYFYSTILKSFIQICPTFAGTNLHQFLHMTKDIWLSLPVKDINKSKEFFTRLGFTFKDVPGNPSQMLCMMVSPKNIAVMLCGEQLFRGFTQHEISDTSKGSEILISIDAESRGEVDDLAEKAAAAGGTVFGKPAELEGWMYSCGFTDLDGHRWNVLYMDMSARK